MGHCEDLERQATYIRDPPYSSKRTASHNASPRVLELPQNAKITWKNTMSTMRNKLQQMRGSRFRLINGEILDHRASPPASPTPSKTSSLKKLKQQSRNFFTAAAPKFLRSSKSKSTSPQFVHIRRPLSNPSLFAFHTPQYSSPRCDNNNCAADDDHRSPSTTSSKQPPFEHSNTGSTCNSEGPYTPGSAVSPTPEDRSHSRTYHYQDQSLRLALRQSIASDTHFTETLRLGFPPQQEMPTNDDDADESYPYPQTKHHPYQLANPMYWDPSETSLTALPRLPEPIASRYKEIVLGGHGFGNRPNTSVDAIAQHYDRSSPSDDDGDDDFYASSPPTTRTTEVKGLRNKSRQRRREMTLRVTTSGWEEAIQYHPRDETSAAAAAAARYSCCEGGGGHDDDDPERDSPASGGGDGQSISNFWSWDMAQRSPEFMARITSSMSVGKRGEASSTMDSESEYEYEHSMGRF